VVVSTPEKEEIVVDLDKEEDEEEPVPVPVVSAAPKIEASP
jgi:ribonuclease PH